MLADRSFALVLTSPLQRSRRTCELAGLRGADVLDDLRELDYGVYEGRTTADIQRDEPGWTVWTAPLVGGERSEEHTSELQSLRHLVCRLLLEKKKYCNTCASQ